MSRRQTPTTTAWFAPTREAILECLRAADVPMTPAELAERLEVPSTHFDNLRRRLLAMERDGQLLPNRKGVLLLASKLDLMAGRVQGHRDGFGFLIPDAGGPDMFLSPREMQKAMHGDRVLVRRTGYDSRGRPEGHIVKVTERAHRRLVGRFLNERGANIVVPEDQRIKHDILIPPGDTRHAQHGQVVTAEIVDPPSGQAPPIGRVVEVLGEIGDPGMEIEIAVRKFDVPHQFGEAALAQAAKLPGAVRPAELKGRVDLRDVPLVTIDGEDARDYDDAVYCEPIEAIPARGESVGAPAQADEHVEGARARRAPGFRLIVAIADVSHYVKPGEPLDREALERSTSVYFPRRVIPMLPEKLSNGLCSLNPQVDRLVLVCDMVVSARGQIRAYQFYEAVMHSAARLTYDEVWSMLSGGAGLALSPARAALLPMLRNLHELYRALAAARQGRGAIDLETVETKIVCDPAGRIERIVPSQRNDAHRLIEECMLAANVCTADFMRRSRHPGLFRVHEGPTPERLLLLREFLRSVGLALGGGDEPTPRDYAGLAAQVRARPDSALLQTMLLRSMKQAVYSPENIGHFGLAYEAYTHFTSPIRRYPDLLTHRVIKALLAGVRYRPALVGESGERGLPPASGAVVAPAQARQLEHENWEALGAICSANERRADEASRDVEAWLKCMYVRERIGEQFAGRVTGVAPFGVFVTLNDLYVEGLVHVSELGGEYFQYNESAHELRGERTGRRFRLTDELDVQVSRVDLEARRIDFRPVERLDFRAISRIRRREAADDGSLRPDAIGAVTPPPEEMAASEPGRPVRGPAVPSKTAGSKTTGARARKAARPKTEKVRQARAERLAARSRRGALAAANGSRRKRGY
ncbi:MAG: ribonuclease R [Lautropia sp.]|nr:ribonuclease R [Lautropia sp.]MCL4700858.1 ribonuclease R [Burkholderiaceae bacterium]MDL1908345.1 ribonuclease R [Betaproteobacteria bacterium PRO1]